MTKRGGGSDDSGEGNASGHRGREEARLPEEIGSAPKKEKGQVASDLAFTLKLSAGGSLFRVRTRRSRRRPRGH